MMRTHASEPNLAQRAATSSPSQGTASDAAGESIFNRFRDARQPDAREPGAAASQAAAHVAETPQTSTAEALTDTPTPSPAAAHLQQMASSHPTEATAAPETLGATERENTTKNAIASLSENFPYLRKAESDIAAANPGSRIGKLIKLGSGSSGSTSLFKPKVSTGDQVKKSQQWMKHTNRFPNDIRKSVTLEGDVKSKLTNFNAAPTKENKDALNKSVIDFEGAVSAAKKEDKNARVNDVGRFGFGLISSGITKLTPSLK